MIQLGFYDLFFLFFLLWIVWLGILAWRMNNRARKNEWHVSNSHLFHCDKCHWSFVPKESVNWCRCPRCNAICIRRRRN